MNTVMLPQKSEVNQTTLQVRPARSTDYPAASAIFRSLMGESFLLNVALWDAVCEEPTHDALVAELDGAVVGLAVAVVSDRVRLTAGTRRRRYHLDQLIVAPSHRRKGIARALLDQVIARAAAEAPSYIIVNCDFMNVAARKTYESAGLNLVRQSSDRFEIAFPG